MYGFQPIQTHHQRRHHHDAGSSNSSSMPAPFSLRRRSTTSSEASEVSRASFASVTSAASSINSVLFRQTSYMDNTEEQMQFASKLSILEPRPVLYFGSMEERFASL